MTFDEFMGDWDKCEYAASLHNLDEPQLRKLHYDIRQKVMRADATTATAGASAVFFSVFSLPGVGIGYRKRRYNAQKQEMIEARMREMDWEKSKLQAGDFFRAVMLSALAAAIIPGVDCFADQFLDHAAGEGAQYFTSNHTSELWDAALNHKADLLNGISDGVCAQVGTVADAISGNATNLVPLSSVANNSTAFLGDMAGQTLAHAAEVDLASQIAKGGIFLGVDNLLGSRVGANANLRSPTRTSKVNTRRIQVQTPSDFKQYKRDRRPVSNRAPYQNSNRRNGTDWADNLDYDGRNSIKKAFTNKQEKGPNHQASFQMPSETTLPREEIKMAKPIFTQVFFILLYPALINDIFDFKIMSVANLFPAAYDFHYSSYPAITTTLSFVFLPGFVIWLCGKQALWFATFCLQFLFAVRIHNFRLIEFYEVALVFVPLLFCSSGMLSTFVLGICSVSILAEFNALCFSKEEREMFLGRFVLSLDYQSVYWLVLAYFSSGNARCFLSGCAAATFVLSILQFTYGKTQKIFFVSLRDSISRDRNFAENWYSCVCLRWQLG